MMKIYVITGIILNHYRAAVSLYLFFQERVVAFLVIVSIFCPFASADRIFPHSVSHVFLRGMIIVRHLFYL